ncbi:MAG TPA: ATP-binding protein, partial [Syntrophales bacterium]|nr:ATP-binding protein [Syntrophales bacterium]
LLNKVGTIAKIGGWEMDMATGKATWTKGTYDIVEIDYDNPIPGLHEHVGFYLPEYREMIENTMETLIETKQPMMFEAALKTATGNIKWCQAFGEAVVEDEQVVKLRGTFQDITDRKKIEEEIKALNRELEQRVATRTAELAEKTRQMETFTYSVSHDLKAPLRGIDGYSRLLLEDHFECLDEEGRTFLTTIRQATEQMRQLIEDLLAYSRMERRELASHEVHPFNVIQTLLAERTEEINARNVSIIVDMPDIVVKTDPEGLAQILRNLLDNALKFTDKTPAPHIEIGGQDEEGKHYLIWVRDNGIGFDMCYHDRIFEIFQRLHSVEEYPGTGIGMAIVQKAIQRMGGRVWAESAPGKGATFYLEVPK